MDVCVLYSFCILHWLKDYIFNLMVHDSTCNASKLESLKFKRLCHVHTILFTKSYDNLFWEGNQNLSFLYFLPLGPAMESIHKV